MRSLRIHINLSRAMLENIDEAAKASFQTRSAFIREAIALRLKQQHIGQNPDPMRELQDMIDKARGNV